MLKRVEVKSPHDERPIGEIVTDLVDEGKAYAKAELDYAKALATAKAKALRAPAILLVAAAFVAMGALNALCVAIFVALATLMSPLIAGIVAFVLIGAVAAGLGWAGVEKLRKLP